MVLADIGIVATDWYANKKGMPWFWAVINHHFSKMAECHWLSTPDDTNIGESAHTLSNLYTGIGLSILEGILWCVLHLIVMIDSLT